MIRGLKGIGEVRLSYVMVVGPKPLKPGQKPGGIIMNSKDYSEKNRLCINCNRFNVKYDTNGLCRYCYFKDKTKIPLVHHQVDPVNRLKTIEEVISKPIPVKHRINANGTTVCRISLPSCFKGKLIRITIVDE